MRPKRSLATLSSAIFACLTLASCGLGAQETSGMSTKTTGAHRTGSELIPINSNNVSLAGFNSRTSVMTVQFKNGARYEYYGVPLELWTSFLDAQPDPWSLVGYPRLVQGGFQYRQIA